MEDGAELITWHTLSEAYLLNLSKEGQIRAKASHSTLKPSPKSASREKKLMIKQRPILARITAAL